MAEIGYFAIILVVAISAYTITAFIISIITNNERLKRSAKGGVAAICMLTRNRQ